MHEVRGCVSTFSTQYILFVSNGAVTQSYHGLLVDGFDYGFNYQSSIINAEEHGMTHASHKFRFSHQLIS